MQQLFHMITSLDMIRLYLTPKDKDKDKDIGHSPKLGTTKGMPLPKEISLHIYVLVDHVVLGKTLPWQRLSIIEGYFSLEDPAFSSQTHVLEL